jgi:hypothetical protein
VSVIATSGGLVLIFVVLREVFHSLFHPAGRGRLSMGVFRGIWWLTGRLGEKGRSLAGPASMVLVIGLWIVVLVVGWALVYWPALPERFIFASPLDPQTHDGLVDALYFSWVTQATLGFGDIAPRNGLLRVLAPAQATIGFGLFTVAVTWVLSVYPALQRQRATASMAHSLCAVHEPSAEDGHQPSPLVLARRMERLAEMLARVRVDFVQYPSTFYFAAPERSLSLAHALPHVAALAARSDLAPDAQPAAAELGSALDLLAEGLRRDFLAIGEGSRDAVLDAYRHHTEPQPGTDA